MCRFLIYHGPPLALADLVTEPDNSLINQSYRAREREEPLNGDGFGVAWYAPSISDEPALFRSVTPAWNNQNLRHLARVTVSSCVLGHVRAASAGLAVAEANTHPFVHGRFAFMHNGEIGGFRTIRRALLGRLSAEAFGALEGTTDSEHLFMLFLDRIARAPEPAAEQALAGALEGAIGDVLALLDEADVREPSYLNVAVSDGRGFVACRFTTGRPEDAPSLHVHTGRRYVCEDGLCRMVDPGGQESAVIVSSEVLSEDPGWKVVPPGSLVVVSAAREVTLRPFVL